MKNNKIKNIIASKKGIDKIAVYFLILLVVSGIIGAIYACTFFVNNGGCWGVSHSYYNTSITPSSYFYNGDFEEINDRYIKDSVGFNFDLESEKKNSNIIPVDTTSYVNEELDWDKLYAYFYQYIENKGRGRCIFRNQGCYININGDYCLIYYLTPTEIYFNLDNLENMENKDGSKVINIFLDAIYDGAIFKDRESMLSFFDYLGSKSSILGTYFLMWDFRDTHADLKKPVIYLYPEKEIDISVTVSGADLTTTYPKYENGWNITAYPDGTLIDGNGREYNYLYWEGLSNNFIDMSKGFVVSKDNYIEFLEEKLDYIGLSNKESADFISYWLPYMNEFEYCQVSFQMENYEEQVKLDFSVAPDNELRVFVAFKGLDETIDIEEQDLSYYADFKRDSFVVVEWGGSFIK